MKLSEKFYSRGSNIDKDIGSQSDLIALTNQTKRAYLSSEPCRENIRHLRTAVEKDRGHPSTEYALTEKGERMYDQLAENK